MVSDEEAKAVQESAKAVREALPIVDKNIDRASGFLHTVLGVTLEQAAGIWNDKLRYRRWENQLRLMQRASTRMHELGIEDSRRFLSLNVGIPLIEAATLEENEDMQEKWALLLANALDPRSNVEVKRHLVSILQDLGPLEARLLDAIVNAPSDILIDGYVPTTTLPESYNAPEGKTIPEAPGEDTQIALWNLSRLGCIAPGMTWGGLSVTHVQTTALGRALVRACSPRVGGHAA